MPCDPVTRPWWRKRAAMRSLRTGTIRRSSHRAERLALVVVGFIGASLRRRNVGLTSRESQSWITVAMTRVLGNPCTTAVT